MEDSKHLRLISVRPGKSGDFFWVSMDGAAENCNAEAFADAFPQMSCVIVDGEFSQPPEKVGRVVAERIGTADVCLVNSDELFAFTRDREIYMTILSGAKNSLPPRP